MGKGGSSENDRYGLLARWLVVHPSSSEDGSGTYEETPGNVKIKDCDTSEERRDNGQASSETLHDVIRILDDDGSDKAAKDLDGDDSPCPGTEIAEEMLKEPGGMRGVEDG